MFDISSLLSKKSSRYLSGGIRTPNIIIRNRSLLLDASRKNAPVRAWPRMDRVGCGIDHGSKLAFYVLQGYDGLLYFYFAFFII
jgi:hypothetical protein